jgi:imidazoleglycerol phosphate synthase glutamine amidotransferase subunit HisH
MGWNRVEAGEGCRLIESGFAYFANSYRLVDPPDGFCAAFSDHGGRFVAALERGGLLACQFHPELSGGWGLLLLKRWLEQNGGGAC